jgi:hypothetical protein
MAMCLRKALPSLGLRLALALVVMSGCVPRLPPALPAGITLEPGRYLEAVYRSPDFDPAQAVYLIEPFPVARSSGVAAASFQAILQNELTRSWQANGLRLSPRGDTTVSGTVQYVDIGGTSYRWLSGSIYSDLVVSGTITRGSQILYAFQDRIHLSSPVKPGPPAPKEADLLLQESARTFAIHLLTEMLLYGLPAEGK